jgi:hypothetical protein
MERNDDLQVAAEGLASHPEVSALLGKLVHDEDLRRAAQEDGRAFLAEQGFDIPEGLGIKFGELLKPDLGRPVPDWEPFSIRLTRCITFIVRDEPGKPPHTETVCFGIEIVRNPVPGGPRG